MIPFLLILSVLPTVLILIYLYRRDKYEQEPLSLLLKAFGLGALSTVFVIFIVQIFGITANTGNHIVDAFIVAFFMAAIPEELLKFVMLYLLIWNNKNFNERFDGIIYAVFVSMGFATVENILYVLQNGAGTAIVRALTAVPAHALFGVTMGFYFAYAKFLPERKSKYLILSIGMPILLHGIYDFILMWQANLFEQYSELSALLTVVFITFVVYLWIMGFKKIKKLSADFYFQGIPQHELQEYLNKQDKNKIAILPPPPPPVKVSFLRNWQEVTPNLFENEKSAIRAKYPDAMIENSNGLITVLLVANGNYQWILQLAYARNYRKLKEQLRVYIIEPDLNELIAIVNEMPYVKTDLANNKYLATASENEVAGVVAIDNAIKWIGLFEKWVNGDIELNEFKIN